MIQFKDVIHLYLGCRVFTGKRTGRFAGIDLCQHDNSITMLTVRYSDDIDDDWSVLNDNENFQKVKPLLYPLSAMTEEHTRYIWVNILRCNENTHDHRSIKGWAAGDDDGDKIYMNVYEMTETINYLRSKYFDCDNLIPSGQALDATKQKGADV